MTKELEALENIKSSLSDLCYEFTGSKKDLERGLFESDYESVQIIETALKKQEQDQKKLKALEVVKELFDFDFAIRFGNNQTMLKIINKRTNEYWELPIPKDKYDLLRGELL